MGMKEEAPLLQDQTGTLRGSHACGDQTGTLRRKGCFPPHAFVWQQRSAQDAVREVYRSLLDEYTSLAAVCTTRSRIVGIPRGHSPPPGFGIMTRRTGWGFLRHPVAGVARGAACSRACR
jgi:hypothetical protein